MYLSHVHIKNFRSIEKLDVEFRKGLTVVVGPNNIGKTNLIDAVRFALGPGSTGSFRSAPRPTDLCRSTGAQSFRVDLTFSDIDLNRMGDFVECLSYNQKDPSSSTIEIHYEWSWDEHSERYSERRWGGPTDADNAIPSDILQLIPFVYLEPLRDALGTLLAGRMSRVGSLLRKKKLNDSEAVERIEQIIDKANKQLELDEFVGDVIKTIQQNITEITSSDLSQSVGLATSVQKFDSIVNSLNLMLRISDGFGEDGAELFKSVEIRENGLGYNNVLYIATILAELSNYATDEVPILCVEEPEAHLHPQLQILLGEYFKSQASKGQQPLQVILTTHSPNLAAHLPLETLNVLHAPSDGQDKIASAPLWKCGLTKEEKGKVERLMDVTKSSLFFARAVILVEGVCEQLLLPRLAAQIGCSIEGKSVSVIPVHGLNYVTLSKLYGRDALRLKCAIITDGDPDIVNRDTRLLDSLPNKDAWKSFPGDPKTHSDTANEYVSTFRNQVTLEYDLAAEPGNADFMLQVWRDSMDKRVPQFTKENLDSLADDTEKATFMWQGICQISGGAHKARFAQELAEALHENSEKAEAEKKSFVVPQYIHSGLEHVGCVPANQGVV